MTLNDLGGIEEWSTSVSCIGDSGSYQGVPHKNLERREDHDDLANPQNSFQSRELNKVKPKVEKDWDILSLCNAGVQESEVPY